jgi:hypothetical protein
VVLNGEQQVFTGTKDECEKWIQTKKGPTASRFSIKDSATINIVEEDCAKKALKEAAEEEAEIVDDETVEESEEEIPEETIDTVEDFVKNFDEYDGKLKLEFKPIVIDGKEYPIKQLLWDDTLEEGKLVAEIIFDMPEETEEVVEESVDQEVLNETLRLESKDKQLNDLATAIHKAFVAKNLGDSIEVSTSAVKCEFGSGGHIAIKTADKISDKTAEVIKQYALKYLQAEDAKADIAEIKRIGGLTYVILDNISMAKKQAEMVKVEELEEILDIKPSINLSLDGGQGNDVDVL